MDAPETAEPLAEPLFLEFFYLLRRSGLPVTTREWLTFVEAMDKGLIAASLEDNGCHAEQV